MVSWDAHGTRSGLTLSNATVASQQMFSLRSSVKTGSPGSFRPSRLYTFITILVEGLLWWRRGG